MNAALRAAVAIGVAVLATIAAVSLGPVGPAPEPAAPAARAEADAGAHFPAPGEAAHPAPAPPTPTSAPAAREPGAASIEPIEAALASGRPPGPAPEPEGASGPPRASVAGLVLDEAGQPLTPSDVELELVGAGHGTLRRARTDARGRFRVEDVPAGRWLAMALSARHLGDTPAPLLVGAAGEVEVELRAVLGRTIAGRVVDTAGSPVAGARVATETRSFRHDHLHTLDREARTSADGTFTLEGLAAGAHDLTVESAAAERAGGSPGRARARAAAGATDVQIVLEVPGTIRGLVRDGATGAPRPGAWVAAARERPTGAADSDSRDGAVSDAEGAFRLDVAPGPYRVSVTGGDLDSEAVAATVREGEIVDVELIVTAPYVVRGRVLTSPERRPIAGAEVRLDEDSTAAVHRLRADGRAPPSVETGPEGEFRIVGLPPGPAVLAIRARGTSATRTAIVVPERGGVLEVEVLLPLPGVIRGRALDGDGRPRAGAVVSVRHTHALGNAETRVGADGRYAIEGLVAGTWMTKLRVTEERGDDEQARLRFVETRVVAVESGRATDVDFTEEGLDRRRRVLGVVKRRGAPVPRLAAVLTPRDRAAVAHAGVDTDAEGRFEVEIPAGRWVLTRRPGAWLGEVVVPDEGTGPVAVEVHLPEGSIQGRVTEAATGAPVGAANVLAIELDTPRSPPDALSAFGGASGHAVAGVDGTFEVRDLRPGTYELRAVVRGLGGRSAAVRVGEGRAQASLELAPVTSLRGRVLGPDGAPVQRGYVVAIPGGHPIDMARLLLNTKASIEVDGSFEIEQVTPGTCTVFAASGRNSPRTIALEAGATEAPLEIRLPAQAAIRLEVVDAAGEPVGGCWSILRRADGGLAKVTSSELSGEGVYPNGRIDFVVEPGRYVLHVMDGRRRAPPVPIEVGPGEFLTARATLP